MKCIQLVILNLLFLFSCSTPTPFHEITIEGNIKNLQDGKIYLADANSWANLDSAVSENGKFTFKLNPDSGFTPSKVALQYKPLGKVDSLDRYIMHLGYLRVQFPNHTKGADSLKYYSTSFMLDKELIRVSGDMQGKGKARVFAGEETDVMYEDWKGEFGWLGNLEGKSKAAKLTEFKNKIQDHPASSYLLSQIYLNKEQFSEKELEEIFALFNQNLQQSIPGGKVRSYLANRMDPNLPYQNFTLQNAENKSGWLFNNNAKVNMLVFWASWCGPCREEIPALKEIYKVYDGTGLNLVSVSIDEKPENWHKALGKEKMDWQQLIVERNKIDEVKQKFNFSAIPLVVLTDSLGKEIKRFTGNGEENITSIREVISTYCQKQI